MKKSNSQKISLGLFIILSTLFLIMALYYIGNRQNLFGKTFKISAVFNNVNGLILGNNVRYSGINVGTVKNINMINDTTICVDMIIEDKFLKHLKKNVVAGISSDGLVGSMVINIAPKKDFSLEGSFLFKKRRIAACFVTLLRVYSLSFKIYGTIC